MLDVVLGLIIMIRWPGRGGPHVYLNLCLDSALKLAITQIGVVKAISQLMAAPAALVTPSVLARWRRSAIVGLAGLGAGLSLLPLALFPHPLAGGLAFASMTVLFPITSPPVEVFSQEIVPPRWRPASSGIISAATVAALAVAALTGGYLNLVIDYMVFSCWTHSLCSSEPCFSGASFAYHAAYLHLDLSESPTGRRGRP